MIDVKSEGRCESPSRNKYTAGCRCVGCREESRLYHAEYRKNNANRVREYTAAWYRRDLEKHRAMRRGVGARRRAETISLLGGKCARCSFSDARALQVDHVNGGGTAHRESFGHSASTLLNEVKSNPEMFQLLCANCNWIKRYENDEVAKGRRWNKKEGVS